MSLKMIWVDYCENGSIHGLRYTIQRDMKPWERFVWTLLLIVASSAILVLVFASWEKYLYSSMKIVVDEPRYPLTMIDFPAVTVCPVNKIMYSKAVNLVLNKYSNDSDLRTRWSNSVQSFGRMRFPHNTDLYFFLLNKTTVDIPLDDIPDLMLKLGPTLDEMFHACFWKGIRYKCSDILRFQRTEEGFCYSFNSKTAERSAKYGGRINPPLDGPEGTLIPLRNNAAGKGTGLKVIMNHMSDEYFPNDKRGRGFNVMVHPPETFPDVSIGYKVHAKRDHVYRISVAVAQVKADDSLRRLSRLNDKCFMYNSTAIDEPPYFESNHENTCYSQCRMNTIYKVCNCTQYFFEKYKGLGSYCGIQHMPCLINSDVLQRNPEAPENEPGFPKWSLPASMNCSCPPPCSFITYTTELKTDVSRFIINAEPTNSSYNVIVEVNYRGLFGTSYKRFMKYSTRDLLVSFDGVASLFLGCSLVSVVEFLYVIYRSCLAAVKRKYGNGGTNGVATSSAETPPQYAFTH